MTIGSPLSCLKGFPSFLSLAGSNPIVFFHSRGLDSVPEGFEMHRQGKISAQKIGYELL